MRSKHTQSRVDGRLCVVALVTVLWPAHAWADWIVSAFGGVAHTQSSTMDLSLPSNRTQLTLTDVDYRGQSFQSPQYYGLRGTWIPNGHRWFGIEGEWIHAKVYAEVEGNVHALGTLRGVPIDATIPLSSIVSRVSLSHGLNFILANVTARHGFGPSDATGAHRLVGVVRAGAGPTLPHAESQIDNVYFEQYEAGGLGVQVGGGVEFSLWRGLGALGEYKFTWASPEIDVTGGQATIPSRSHHFAFGIQYRF
jgi:lipid A oxidase